MFALLIALEAVLVLGLQLAWFQAGMGIRGGTQAGSQCRSQGAPIQRTDRGPGILNSKLIVVRCG
jgi:hypothetical protein